MYSREIWSISGPAKDVGWDNIDLNPRNYSDDVAYTDEETELFKRYYSISIHIPFLLSIESNFFSSHLQQNAFYYKSNRIEEPFYILNGFWKLSDSDCRDHHQRSSIGLQRSSPKYFNQNLRNVTESYFNGTFNNSNHLAFLMQVEKETRDSSSIEGVMQPHLKGKLAYYAKSFIGCLHAYIHSPIQTETPRKPIENKDAQTAFENLLKRMDIQFFIQKVNFEELGHWPQVAIVSKMFRTIKT